MIRTWTWSVGAVLLLFGTSAAVLAASPQNARWVGSWAAAQQIPGPNDAAELREQVGRYGPITHMPLTQPDFDFSR